MNKRGGHWNTLCVELAERSVYAGTIWQLLAQIEHVLDFGISGETCYGCAQRRVILALESYFDAQGKDPYDALTLLQGNEHVCERCQRDFFSEERMF